MQSQNRNELLLIIERAFSWRRKPTRAELTTPEAGSYLTKWDVAELALFCQYDWRDLTLEVCEKYSEVYFVLPPDGFCYYLPGFLSVAVKWNTVDNLVSDCILMELDRPPTTAGWDEHFSARYGRLTITECKVLEDWLWWVSEFEEKKGNDGYWSEEDRIVNALVTTYLLQERLRVH